MVVNPRTVWYTPRTMGGWLLGGLVFFAGFFCGVWCAVLAILVATRPSRLERDRLRDYPNGVP